MKLFISSREREELAASPDPEAALTLAWALRQEDPERSATLFTAGGTLTPLTSAHAWQTLAWAEAAVLAESLDTAAQHLAEARRAFADARHALGLAFCDWTEAQLCWVAGDEAEMDHLLFRLITRFDQLAEPDLACAVRQDLAARLHPRDREASRTLLSHAPGDNAVTLALRGIAEGLLAATDGEHLRAIQRYLPAMAALQDLGMRYRVVGGCTLLAYSFDALGDTAQATVWAQRGLDGADPRWILRTSTCRLALAEALERQGRTADARALYLALIEGLQQRTRSRVMQQARRALGKLEAAEGRWAAARVQFEALQAGSERAHFHDMAVEALLGMSVCAQGEGLWAQALALVDQGLSMAQRQRFTALEGQLLVQAGEIDLAMGQAERALTRLAQLQTLGGGLDEAQLHLARLRLAARVHERLGQWQQALHCEREAGQAEREQLRKRYEQRLSAHEALEELRNVQQQNLTLRQEHRMAAERAESAEQGLHTLAHLAQVGLGLTARLRPDELFPLVERELQALMPVDVMLLFEVREHRLELLHGRAGAAMLDIEPLSLDDPVALSARCAREDRLLRLHGEQTASRIPNVDATHSLMFAPLQWRGRVVGVLSLQAHAPDVYGPREEQLVISLAAYMAIALQNARTYERVSALQLELAERRRQSAMGSLVAGVAHELNTPLGNSLLAVGALQSQVATLHEQLHHPTPRRSQLVGTCMDLTAGLNLAEQGIRRAAALVRDFKELASAPESEPLELLDPAVACQDVVALMTRAFREAGLRVTLELAPTPPLWTRQHSLHEVLRALLENVLIHAEASQVQLQGWTQERHYLIEVCDDGRGILMEPASRVFDPFISTRFGQGGSGLGLSVALHRARALLGGDLTVRSTGRGTCFRLSLPLAGPPAPAGEV